MIPSLHNKPDEEKLLHSILFSLGKRRQRGRLIECFKILNGFANVDPTKLFVLHDSTLNSNVDKFIQSAQSCSSLMLSFKTGTDFHQQWYCVIVRDTNALPASLTYALPASLTYALPASLQPWLLVLPPVPKDTSQHRGPGGGLRQTSAHFRQVHTSPLSTLALVSPGKLWVWAPRCFSLGSTADPLSLMSPPALHITHGLHFPGLWLNVFIPVHPR